MIAKHRPAIALVSLLFAAIAGPTGGGAFDASPLVAASTAACSRDCPSPAASDLRAIPLGGPALHSGYADTRAGLVIRLLRARTGRVTADEGCSLPVPQYYLYLRVRMTNSRPHAVTFDWVGVTVQDRSGHVAKPFDWSTYPSHPTLLGPGQHVTAWIPYSVNRLHHFVVRWANTFDPSAVLPNKPPYSVKIPHRTFHPQPIARYKVVATGVQVCRVGVAVDRLR